MKLTPAQVLALQMLLVGPCETSRSTVPSLRWISGASATALVRRGLAEWSTNKDQIMPRIRITKVGRTAAGDADA